MTETIQEIHLETHTQRGGWERERVTHREKGGRKRGRDWQEIMRQ